MARVYTVPSSKFQAGMLGAACRWEADRDRILRRKASLKAELANIPAKLAEAERGIAENSLDSWRIDRGR